MSDEQDNLTPAQMAAVDESYRVAVLSSEIVLVIAFVFWTITLTSANVARCKLKKRVPALYYIIFNLFCGWISNLITNLLFYIDMTEQPVACDVIAKFSVATFATGSLFLYLFLFERAKYVTNQGDMGLVGKVAWYFTLCTPLVGIFIMIFVEGNVTNKICLVEFPSEIVIGFLAADTSLSCLYLYLFLVPVVQGIQYFNNQSDQRMVNTLTAAAKRNLICSIGAMVSTFLSMLFNIYTEVRESDPFDKSWSIWVIFSTVLGSTFTSTFMLGMSTVWIPFYNKGQSNGNDRSNERNGNKKPKKHKSGKKKNGNGVLSDFRSSVFQGEYEEDDVDLLQKIKAREPTSEGSTKYVTDADMSENLTQENPSFDMVHML